MDKYQAASLGYNISPTAGSNLGTRRTRESKARSSAALKQHYSDPEIRQRHADLIRSLWKDAEYRKNHEEADKARHERIPQQLRRARAGRRQYPRALMSRIRSFRKPGNQFRLWKFEERSRLTRLFGERSVKEIAVILGRSVHAINVEAHRLGLRSKGTREFSERMRMASLKREEKDSSGWRDEALLRKLYVEEGLSFDEIGRQLGCSGVSVGKWIRLFGLTRPRLRGQRGPTPREGPE